MKNLNYQNPNTKKCGGIFDKNAIQDSITHLQEKTTEQKFWEDNQSAQSILKQISSYENELKMWKEIDEQFFEVESYIELIEEGEEVTEDAEEALDSFEKYIEKIQIRKLLNGRDDYRNAILTIHPGAGGTESQDWAEMLLRLYLRWTEQRGFSREVIDLQPGDEAGIKSVTLTVNGDYAYGLLLAEAGVHRLVRISPYDQAGRRHTSFASVFVWPELPDDVEVEIEDKDLRIDTYRSSGAGGQHVNVTDSAVRITHIPTGIVVSCQNERSQHRNRDSAMKVLRARLYDMKLREQQAKLEQIGGEKKEIAFGNQIRSYVLHPYRLIKDHRTKMEVGDVDSVLDGQLDGFIKAYLMQKASGTLGKPADDE